MIQIPEILKMIWWLRLGLFPLTFPNLEKSIRVQNSPWKTAPPKDRRSCFRLIILSSSTFFFNFSCLSFPPLPLPRFLWIHLVTTPRERRLAFHHPPVGKTAVDHGGLGGITWGYVYSRFNSLSLSTNQPLVENIVARKALDFLVIKKGCAVEKVQPQNGIKFYWLKTWDF